MSLESILSHFNPWWANSNSRVRTVRPVSRPELVPLLATLGRGQRAVLIRGLRQVGKTVLLLHAIDHLLDSGCPPANITFLDFEDERIHRTLSPAGVVSYEPPGFDPTRPRFLFFDEVTRFDGWSRWLKSSVDTSRHGATEQDRLLRFAVTDSSAALLELDAVESGYGRLHEIEVEGVNFETWLRIATSGECAVHEALLRIPDALDLYLIAGGFPGQVDAALRREFDDLRRTLRKDIVAAGIHRDLSWREVDSDGMEELFRYLIEESGAVFVRQKRAADVGADPRAVADWMMHLASSQLVRTLGRYSTKATGRLRESKKPKVYAGDHGIVTAFATATDPLADPDSRARIVAAAVYRHLREAAVSLGSRLEYFRTLRGDLDINFVIAHKKSRIAVEAKSSARLKPEKRERLLRAAEAYGATRTIVVYGGSESFRDDAIHFVPLEKFLLDPTGTLLKGGES